MKPDYPYTVQIIGKASGIAFFARQQKAKESFDKFKVDYYDSEVVFKGSVEGVIDRHKPVAILNES